MCLCLAFRSSNAFYRSRYYQEDDEEEERLIGWKGDTYKPKDLLSESQHPVIQVISWKPRAFIIRNFINDIEAQHIADLAAGGCSRVPGVPGVPCA